MGYGGMNIRKTSSYDLNFIAMRGSGERRKEAQAEIKRLAAGGKKEVVHRRSPPQRSSNPFGSGIKKWF